MGQLIEVAAPIMLSFMRAEMIRMTAIDCSELLANDLVLRLIAFL
jgi:hypothetical protein